MSECQHKWEDAQLRALDGTFILSVDYCRLCGTHDLSYRLMEREERIAVLENRVAELVSRNESLNGERNALVMEMSQRARENREHRSALYLEREQLRRRIQELEAAPSVAKDAPAEAEFCDKVVDTCWTRRYCGLKLGHVGACKGTRLWREEKP